LDLVEDWVEVKEVGGGAFVEVSDPMYRRVIAPALIAA